MFCWPCTSHSLIFQVYGIENFLEGTSKDPVFQMDCICFWLSCSI